MKKKTLILIKILLLMLTKDICAEQIETQTKPISLEPITVTASKTERRLSEVPSSMGIISQKTIDDSNAKNIPDLLKDQAGIYMYDGSGIGTVGRINMRGFWGGMSTHQLILIDGIPQNSIKDKLVSWDLIPLDNIERIEVLKGPASALYGDDAMSGVINIITKRPSPKPEIKASYTYGSYNTQDYRLSASGVFKKLGYYIGGSRKSTDGFRKYTDYERIHLNTKVDLSIDSTQDLRVSFDYKEKERGVLPWAITESQIKINRRQARPMAEDDEGKEVKIDFSTTYNLNMGKALNFEGLFFCRYEDNESFYTSTSGPRRTKEQLGDEDTYGSLLKLITSQKIFGIEHSLTAGIDLENNDYDYKEYNAPYWVREDINKGYEIDRNKVGPYIQDEIRLSDPLRVITGIRYDYIKFDFTDCVDNENSKKEEMSRFTPRCGIVYTYLMDSNLYANFAQAFRSPTIGQMFTYGSSSNTDLKPEKADNYELGIRHRFNDYLKTDISLYWMELDNEIWYDATVRRYENCGQTCHKGLESGLDFKIIKGLTGFANYTYTRAKYSSGEYDGKYISNIPRHKGSLGVRYETDFGLKTMLTATRVGTSFLDSANDEKLYDYTVIDTKIAYEYKWFSAFLAIDNLLAEKYNCYGYTSGATKYFNPAPGRLYTFGVELKF